MYIRHRCTGFRTLDLGIQGALVYINDGHSPPRAPVPWSRCTCTCIYSGCYTLDGQLKLCHFRPGMALFLAISGGDGLAEPSHTTLMQNSLHMGTQYTHLM